MHPSGLGLVVYMLPSGVIQHRSISSSGLMVGVLVEFLLFCVFICVTLLTWLASVSTRYGKRCHRGAQAPQTQQPP